MSITEDLRLPNDLRGALKGTLGPVVSGKLPDKYLKYSPLVAVGDYVNTVLYDQGIVPDMAIIDGKTHRGEYEGKIPDFHHRIEVKNPSEFITAEAWKAVERGLSSKEPSLIFVDGEEDLLSLTAIVLCPEGGIVLYGIPFEGMVVNVVDEEKKEKSWQVINSMEKVNQGG
ncbi:MAG: DUF359 domain-containing protein [Thermoplasmata archaeon]